MAPISGSSNDKNTPAVSGENTAGGDGVSGKGRRGVVGTSDEFQGVYGSSRDNAGVVGESQKFHAVFGISHDPNNAGVFGTNTGGGFGVSGASHDVNKAGVIGTNDAGGAGVVGQCEAGVGVLGESQRFHGVWGRSHINNNAGVFGSNDANDPLSFGVTGVSEHGIGVSGKGGTLAGRFEGDVEVWGDIRLTNADCAEEFDIAGAEIVEAGTVMVLSDDSTLQPSARAYDKRVAGIISGAGDYRPGIVLDKQAGGGHRLPVALLGKVFCKVDARYGPVEVGDLLTTSDTPGHAMRAIDPLQAFGAVLGKALRPLREGQGLIPVLVTLQ